MIKRPKLFAGLVLGLLIVAGCGRSTPQTQRNVKHPTVASLVPAATDLLLAMGAADHLVAVSNFEPPRPEVSALPKVGDYQSTDWEKLTELRPDVMLIFMSPQHTPPGLLQRAAALKIRVINVNTDRLADVFATIDGLGSAVAEPLAGQRLAADLHRQLDAVHERVKAQPPIKTILSLSDERFDCVGRGTYLDELLTIAGGENAVDSSAPYPTFDRERIVELAPSAVLILAPAAPANFKSRAERLWMSLPNLPAARNNRVMTIDDPYALQPGAHIGRVAEMMADALHAKSEK